MKTKPHSIFPLLVQPAILFEAQVVSQPRADGSSLVIYNGSKRMATFIATALNRQGETAKAAISSAEAS